MRSMVTSDSQMRRRYPLNYCLDQMPHTYEMEDVENFLYSQAMKGTLTRFLPS